MMRRVADAILSSYVRPAAGALIFTGAEPITLGVAQ